MALIEVSRHLTGCDTNDEGEVLLRLIDDVLAREEMVELSFASIISASSSFVNSAFVPLLSMMSFDDIKKRIRIVRANSQIADMIRSRLSFETKRAA